MAEQPILTCTQQEVQVLVTAIIERVRDFDPDVIATLGGGDFARILKAKLNRPVVKLKIGSLGALCSQQGNEDAHRPSTQDHQGIRAEALVMAEEGCESSHREHLLSEITGRRVILVNEVDDTRCTLQQAVEVLECEHAPLAICCCVLHNKVKEKRGFLPDRVEFIVGADIADRWVLYPWDAQTTFRNRGAGKDSSELERLKREIEEVTEAIHQERDKRVKVENKLKRKISLAAMPAVSVGDRGRPATN